jgi:hypothetical protein
MSYSFAVKESVHHLGQGPQQERAMADRLNVYTIVQRMPIEADGRVKYRIKSETANIERIATEDQLSYINDDSCCAL